MLFSWAERTPDQPAIRKGSRIWSYAEFTESVSSLGQVLLASGLRPGEVVAVTGPPSFGLIAGMAAVFLSGGVLLTLDRKLPDNRQRLMLRESGAKYVLSVGEERAEDAWMQENGRIVIRVAEETGRTSDQEPAAGEALSPPLITPDSPAYLFFTSGTSGVPKGVLGRHKGLSHFLTWQRETFAVGPGDRAAQLTGLSFDVVLRDIFLALTSGATLCLPEGFDKLDAARLFDWLDREGITLFHTVPSLASVWLGGLPPGVSLWSLRWVFFAGEPLTDALVKRWRQAFPDAGQIVNLYGPTETTLAKCSYIVPEDPTPGIQPVGWPQPQTQALVLSADGRLCKVGEAGEIVIRTPFRSLGYLNAPAETQKRFVRNPFTDDPEDLLYHTGDRGRYRPDGALEILGRLDHQVKIRGVRVEPDEVAAVLSRHPLVKACVVLARPDAQGENSLAAYVAMSAPDRKLVPELRAHVRRDLPDAMVPSAFVLLESLPLTSNGKVDRRALPEPEPAGADERTVTPGRDALELQLIALWEELLNVRPIGVKDNFFDLGGNSLLVARLFADTARLHGKNYPLAALFQAPTIEQLAAVLRQEGKSCPVASLVAIQPGTSPAPLYCIHGGGGHVLGFMPLVKHLGAGQPVYGLQARGLYGEQPPCTRIEEMAAHYVEEIRAFQPQGPYSLVGFSFGGVVAFEMARQLQAQGQQVALLALLDTAFPNRGMPWRRRLAAHFRLFWRLSLKGKLGHLVGEVGKLFRGLARKFSRKREASLPTAFQKVDSLNEQARKNYVPQPYPGRVTFFRAREQTIWDEKEVRWTWGAVAGGGLEILEVPGNHQTFHVEEPNVGVLAEQLKTCLRRAQAGAPAPA
jgi:amino acid adenylation domain-containing protein